PSNDLGTEDRVHFIGEGTLVGDAWNDSPAANGAIRSYVVEFEQNLEPAPLVELRFNETGTNAANTGRAPVSPVFFNSSDMPTDWHSESSLGISGLIGDRAFDNTACTGMGSGGSGGRATEIYDTAVDGLLSLTLQGWFKTESALGSNARFFAKQGTGSGFLFLVPSTGVLSLEIDGSASTMSSAQFSEVGQWIFFAVTYDGTTAANNVKFYKGTPSNAVTLVETRSLGTGRAATNSSGATFGNANGLQRPIDGLLDDIRVFGSKTDNRGALTAAQLEWFRNKDIQNAPDAAALSVSRTNGTLIISWPVYPGGFRLETSSNLTAPVWQAVTNTPIISNDQNTITVPLAEFFAAFRLARPAP
ncbi:MAG TPA: LamG domain-containing protein, partial [Verrucomicrobiae bacterium]